MTANHRSSSLRRVRALARVHARAWSSGGHALSGGAAQALFALALGALVSDRLGPLPFFLFTGSVAWGLMTAALAGDVGYRLRHDQGLDWSAALPSTDFERRAGRALALFGWVAFQTAVTIGPGALLVEGLAPVERLGWLALGLLSNLTFSAALFALQTLLLARLPGLWIALQSALIAGLLAGAVLFLPRTVQLAGLERWSDLATTAWIAWPVSWFAAPLASDAGFLLWLLPAACASIATAVWLSLPAGEEKARHGRSLLDTLVAPLAAWTRRTWVAPAERAGFDLVLRALPAEREVALRALPLLGVPLAFLWFGDTAGGGVGRAAEQQREGLLALILFTPAVYLPVLMAYITASASDRARWMLDLAPLPPEALHGGAFKAVVVRYVVPLYALLVPLAFTQTDGAFVLRIAPLAFAVTVLACRALYASSVDDWPLSRPPADVEAPMQLGGTLLGLGVGLAVLAVVVVTQVPTAGALGLTALLVLLEGLNEARKRRTLAAL